MERNVRRSGRALGAAAIVLSLAACASGGGGAKKEATAPKIEPAWLARVPAEAMAPVEQARADRLSQEDEVNRAGVARKDAEAQLNVSKSEHRTTKARIDTAQARLDAAKSRGQYSEINEAKAEVDRAKLAREVAEAKVKRDEKAVEVAAAREELEKARLRTAETRVSQAEYAALRTTGDTRVQNVDPTRYDQVMAANQNRENAALAKVQKAEGQLQAADTRFEELGRRLQAAQPQPPRG